MGTHLESQVELTDPKMQIFIRENEQLQALELENDVTIAELLESLDADADECRLLASGQELTEEDMTLEDYGIQAESTIEIVHRDLGGGRKRNKKVYTTPKKIKHKRKKVKLAALKFYKVTDTGKIERIGGRWIKPFQTTFNRPSNN